MYGLLRLQGQYETLADPKITLKRDELVADIAKERRRWREAELRYRMVRDGYIERGMHYEAARSEFELARLAAAAGQRTAVAHRARRAFRGQSGAGSLHEARLASQLLREALTGSNQGGGPYRGREGG